MRTITAAVKAELAKGEFRQIHLIEFLFSTPIYLTDHIIDVSWNGNDYEAGGHLLDFDAAAEASDVRLGRMPINLSGVEQSFLALFLTNSYIDIRVVIRRALLGVNVDALLLENGDFLLLEDGSKLLNESAGVAGIIPDPFIIWEGLIEGYSVKETRNNSRLKVDMASHWSDFEKTSSRRTNTASQDRHFTGDLGFAFAAESVREVLWGRK